MRINKVLKAFCLLAALVSVSLTASQAMAAGAGPLCGKNGGLLPNSFFCTGTVAGSPGAKFDGPMSAIGTLGICAANTSTNSCITNGVLMEYTFSDGHTVNADITQSTVKGAPLSSVTDSSGGCTSTTDAAVPLPNLLKGCGSSFLDGTVNANLSCTKSKTPMACCTANGAGTCISAGAVGFTAKTATLTNAVCGKGVGNPISCCTGAGTGNCDNICILADGEPTTGGLNEIKLAPYALGGYVCPKGAVCEYASDVTQAGEGYLLFGNDYVKGTSNEFTGCTQWIQFSANTALTRFLFSDIGPLIGSNCGDKGMAINIQCLGTAE